MSELVECSESVLNPVRLMRSRCGVWPSGLRETVDLTVKLVDELRNVCDSVVDGLEVAIVDGLIVVNSDDHKPGELLKTLEVLLSDTSSCLNTAGTRLVSAFDLLVLCDDAEVE